MGGLRALWGHSGGPLGRSWGALGRSWAALGRSRGALGLLLERPAEIIANLTMCARVRVRVLRPCVRVRVRVRVRARACFGPFSAPWRPHFY